MAPEGAGGAGEGTDAPAAEEKPGFEALLADADYRAAHDAAVKAAVADALKKAEAEAAKKAEDKKKDPLTLANERIAELEAEAKARAIRDRAAELAAEKKLPAELAEYLAAEDEEATAARTEAFAAAWTAAVAAAAKDMVPGYEPRGGSEQHTGKAGRDTLRERLFGR